MEGQLQGPSHVAACNVPHKLMFGILGAQVVVLRGSSFLRQAKLEGSQGRPLEGSQGAHWDLLSPAAPIIVSWTTLA